MEVLDEMLEEGDVVARFLSGEVGLGADDEMACVEVAQCCDDLCRVE